MSSYDAVVIGAGHNGLVCAAYLARAGLRVIVLERRSVIGGCSTTETLLPERPDFRFNRGAIDLAHFQGSSIIDDLGLGAHGLRLIHHDPLWYFPFPDGTAISFFRDVDRTCESIASISAHDAEAYRRFTDLWDQMLDLMEPLDVGPPLRVSRLAGLAGLAGERGEAAVHLLLSSPRDVAVGWFESDQMRGVMGWMGVQAGTAPAQPAAGLALTQLALSHRNGVARAEGGMGGLCASLQGAIESHGGVVQLDSKVDEVLLDGSRGRVAGVRVGSERIDARVVVGTIDVGRLFGDLIPNAPLGPALRRRVEQVHTRCPSLFKVDVALDGLPVMPHPGAEAGLTASINFAPSLEYVERAWATYERDEVADEPPVMCALPSILDPTLAPAGKHTLWLSQFNPVERWRTASRSEIEACADRMIELFDAYAPGTADLVLDRAVTTPIDRERETGNPGGNPFHLDMTVDQSMSFRPVVGLHRYATPIGGLYLSGSGTHPGGGVTGIPGLNAANVVLADRYLPGRPTSVPLPSRLRSVHRARRAWRKLGAHL
jgi:beta-carotene ketolase (CrtO type)